MSILLRAIRRRAALGTVALAGVAAFSAAPAFAQQADFNQAIASTDPNATIAELADYTVEMCVMLQPTTAEQEDLANRCTGAVTQALTADDPEGAVNALFGIANDELPAIDPDVNDVLGGHSSAIAARVSAIGAWSAGAEFANLVGDRRVLLASAEGTESGLGGFGEMGGSGFGGYVTLGYGGGGQDQTTQSEETGFDVDSYSITGGVDYRFSDTLSGGVAIGYSTSEVEFDQRGGGAGGDLESDAYIISGYGVAHPVPNVTFAGLVSYASVDSESSRRLVYSDGCSDPGVPSATCTDNSTVDRTLTAQTDSSVVQAAGTVSYDLVNGGLVFGPVASVSYVNSQIDGFTENDPVGGLDLVVSDTEYESLQATIGGQATYSVGQSWGSLIPHARGGYVYEALDDARDIRVRYANDPFIASGETDGFLLRTDSPDRSRFEIGGGVTAWFPNGWSTYLDGSAVLGQEDVSNYALFLGMRRQF